jgi:hypothetical protein
MNDYGDEHKFELRSLFYFHGDWEAGDVSLNDYGDEHTFMTLFF